ncbi:hypothetical protein KCP78_12500 [Salmonella enterica subsp. enterica]|nr:hypothetical protein KCP78_12500 [Salmonella enterica subsp. enterica]
MFPRRAARWMHVIAGKAVALKEAMEPGVQSHTSSRWRKCADGRSVPETGGCCAVRLAALRTTRSC